MLALLGLSSCFMLDYTERSPSDGGGLGTDAGSLPPPGVGDIRDMDADAPHDDLDASTPSREGGPRNIDAASPSLTLDGASDASPPAESIFDGEITDAAFPEADAAEIIETCASQATCAPTCEANKTCALNCESAGTCAPTCESGGRCLVSCTDTQSCNVVCRHGARCAIACDHSDCRNTTCENGSTCLFLRCVNGASCP